MKPLIAFTCVAVSAASLLHIGNDQTVRYGAVTAVATMCEMVSTPSGSRYWLVLDGAKISPYYSTHDEAFAGRQRLVNLANLAGTSSILISLASIEKRPHYPNCPERR